MYMYMTFAVVLYAVRYAVAIYHDLGTLYHYVQKVKYNFFKYINS